MGQGSSVDDGQQSGLGTAIEQLINRAIQADQWAEVKDLLGRSGVAPNKPFCVVEEGNIVQDPQFTTPLFYALICNSENPKTLFFILENPNVEVNAPVGGVYPLDFAVLHCKDILLTTLLKCDRLDVNLTARKVPPFTEVFLRRKRELVDLFLQRPNLKNGFLEVVKICLEAEKLPDTFSKLILHPSFAECATDAMIYALRRKNTPAAMLTLTSPHLNVNAPLNEQSPNLTPLMLAIEQNNVKVVRSLMQHPKISPNRGKTSTPLQLAVRKGSLAAVQALLGHPDIEVNAAYGETPLTLAVLEGQQDILEALLKAPGLKPNLINASGPHAHTSALYVAVQRAGAERDTPAREVSLELLKALLAHSNIDPRIGLGDRVPLKLAQSNQDQEVVDLLNEKVDRIENPDKAPTSPKVAAAPAMAAAADESESSSSQVGRTLSQVQLFNPSSPATLLPTPAVSFETAGIPRPQPPAAAPAPAAVPVAGGDPV